MSERGLLVDCLCRLNQARALNEAYLRQWAIELNVTPTLEAVLSGKIKPKHT